MLFLFFFVLFSVFLPFAGAKVLIYLQLYKFICTNVNFEERINLTLVLQEVPFHYLGSMKFHQSFS